MSDLLRNHSDGYEPCLGQPGAMPSLKCRAPQAEPMPALCIEMHLGGDPPALHAQYVDGAGSRSEQI